MILDCQQALIRFLKTGLLAANGGPAKTVKEYAGELRSAQQLTELRPLVLVKYSDGFPASQDKYNLFDIITVSDSVVMDKTANMNSNLTLTSSVIEHIAPEETANNRPGIFNKISGQGTYYIDKEKIRAETLVIYERFNIMKIQAYINDNTGP